MKELIKYLIQTLAKDKISLIALVISPLLSMVLGIVATLPNVVSPFPYEVIFLCQMFGVYLAVAGSIVSLRTDGSLRFLRNLGMTKLEVIGAYAVVYIPVAILQSGLVALIMLSTDRIPWSEAFLVLLGIIFFATIVFTSSVVSASFAKDTASLQWVSLPLLLLGSMVVNGAPYLNVESKYYPFGIGMYLSYPPFFESLPQTLLAVVIALLWATFFLVWGMKKWKWTPREF